MKCPQCGKEMSEGYIYNGQQPIQWLPKCVMPARIIFTKRAEGVDLKNKFSFLKESGYSAEAFHCYECHIVIAPTELIPIVEQLKSAPQVGADFSFMAASYIVDRIGEFLHALQQPDSKHGAS